MTNSGLKYDSRLEILELYIMAFYKHIILRSFIIKDSLGDLNSITSFEVVMLPVT